MARLYRLGILAAAALWLGACAAETVAGVGITGNIVSLNATKKTLVDHVVSGITGEDCSVISLEQTGEYCPDKVEVVRSDVYCYRTLAAVDCHYLPDPYKNGHTALASPAPVYRTLPKKKGWFDPE